MLAGIICPLVGQSPHHIRNTQHFIQQVQQCTLQPWKSITFFDVKALFTSVSVATLIQIVQNRLQQDPTLPQRTQLSILQIIQLLEFCLNKTYVLFQSKYYEQVHCAAMGSPISPLIASLFMEEFEVKALSTAPSPLVCGLGLLMTPSPSVINITSTNYYSISTHRTLTSNLAWRNQV